MTTLENLRTAAKPHIEARSVAASDISEIVSCAARRPVRVLVVFNTVFLYGMERYVLDLFDLLRPDVVPHFLLSYTLKRLKLPLLGEIQGKGFHYSFFGDRSDWPKIAWPRSLGELWPMLAALVRGNLTVLRRALGCDVLYLPSISYLYMAILAALYCRLAGKRTVLCFHDLNPGPARRVRAASLLISDFVHHTRLGYEQVVRSHSGVARKRTLILPGRTEVRTDDGTTAELRHHFLGKRNLLFAGQVAQHKGIDLLLEAFARLATDHPDVALHIAGGCTDEAELRSMIAATGAEDRIHYWGFRQDVPDLLRMSYLYVHPSPPSRFQESFGRGVVEAMALGVPVVCFRSGALQEVVVDGATGLVAEQETPAALAQTIGRFLDDPAFRSRCSRAARLRFEQFYSDECIHDAWVQFFRQPAEKGLPSAR
ncbi:MAG TPA: glycosyltransferase family 4 protein [Terriglobales bacterium]|nr:glycosyltransferase family 4 protein [Terriglobales bacterium]